ncbi:MAG: NUDIX domain-containing protein [Candidatus Aenigmarchaeota archaeon]|nr:NUDIX domain-containing protein [Candidatus Aenigmarchaeota archaeon]
MDLSKLDKGVFLVNVQGIVYNPVSRKILIGRRAKDPYIEKLTWTFPGGRAGYGPDLEDSLREQIRKKTGLDVVVREVIFAKTYPEERKILSIYYLCEPVEAAGPVLGGLKVGEGFTELRWVKPTEVAQYFTTSLHRTLFDYLETLC